MLDDPKLIKNGKDAADYLLTTQYMYELAPMNGANLEDVSWLKNLERKIVTLTSIVAEFSGEEIQRFVSNCGRLKNVPERFQNIASLNGEKRTDRLMEYCLGLFYHTGPFSKNALEDHFPRFLVINGKRRY